MSEFFNLTSNEPGLPIKIEGCEMTELAQPENRLEITSRFSTRPKWKRMDTPSHTTLIWATLLGASTHIPSVAEAMLKLPPLAADPKHTCRAIGGD